jgi:hypothetical protein
VGKPQVWSSGGGVQSSAIAALICQGKLPKPDLAVMADTGREYSPVWDYMHEHVIPDLRKAGVELHIAGHELSTVDLWSGKDGNTLIIPAFTDSSGAPGMMPKFCNQEWKVRVVQRFCRQHGIKDADQWIGYTIDEMDRMRVYRDSMPWQHVYPLIERRLRRSDCFSIICEMGWAEPPRSACWMCPYRSDQEWQLMQEECPSDFEKAKQLEAEVQQVDPNAYLHRSCKPIGEVDFDGEPDLFSKPCNSGMCFT